MLLGLCTVLVCIKTVTSGILRGRLFCLPRYFFPEGPARRCLSPARATNLCLPHYRKRLRLVPSDDALILRTARPTHPVAPARIWCADASGKAAISGFPTLPLMFLAEHRTQEGVSDPASPHFSRCTPQGIWSPPCCYRVFFLRHQVTTVIIQSCRVTCFGTPSFVRACGESQ